MAELALLNTFGTCFSDRLGDHDESESPTPPKLASAQLVKSLLVLHKTDLYMQVLLQQFHIHSCCKSWGFRQGTCQR